MAESAALLVDEVLPAVPIPQWVLSFPYQQRLLTGWSNVTSKLGGLALGKLVLADAGLGDWLTKRDHFRLLGQSLICLHHFVSVKGGRIINLPYATFVFGRQCSRYWR